MPAPSEKGPKAKRPPSLAKPKSSCCSPLMMAFGAVIAVFVGLFLVSFVEDTPEAKKMSAMAHAHAQAGIPSKKAPSRYPPQYEGAVKTANDLSSVGRRLDATTAFVRVIDQWPDHAPAYYNLAQVYEDLFDPTNAKKFYLEALKRVRKGDRLRYDIHVNLALIYIAEGEHKSAVKHWRSATHARPGDAQAFYSLGNSLLESEQYEKAATAFRKSLELDDLQPQYYIGLGRALQKMGKPVDEYSQHYNKTLSMAEGNVATQLGLFLREKHPGLAIKLLSKALQANPAVQYTRTIIYTLGQIYHNMKLHDEAKKMYQNAVIRGIFPDSMQRPGIVLKDLLPGYPFPTEATVPGVGKAIDHLEKNFQSISKELALAVEYEKEYKKIYKMDNENLTDHGSWKQIVFVRDGVMREMTWAAFPATTKVLEQFVNFWADQMPKGSIEYSVLPPREHIKLHCGPSNHRIRLHLALSIPEPRNSARIRVANETRTWEDGKVLVIDDSFEHEVWNDSDKERRILIVDMWHPALDENAREQIRRSFGWNRNPDWSRQRNH